MKTLSKTLNKEFNFEAKHLGLFLDDNLWSHDKWFVTIEGQTFDYNTGIGHRIADPNKFNSKEEFSKVMNKSPKKEKQNLLMYNSEVQKCSKVKPLQIDDILYSLIVDSSAGSETFEDFCDNFGYNEDSIKALDIYRDCQKTLNKLRSLSINISEAEELFQDY